MVLYGNGAASAFSILGLASSTKANIT
jgi:hypothetical protein